MTDDARFYAGWDEPAASIARTLRPLFRRDGADYYVTRTEKEIRVGWESDRTDKLVGTLRHRQDGVRITLKVGRNSVLLAPSGPLQSDTSDPESAVFTLADTAVPSWLPQAVDAAYRNLHEIRQPGHD